MGIKTEMRKGKSNGASEIGLESVKLRRSIVNRVRENKEKTNMDITLFFELAAREKLVRGTVDEIGIWDYLTEKIRKAGVDDNNFTARQIFDYFKKYFTSPKI